jgi:hypothetical protein
MNIVIPFSMHAFLYIIELLHFMNFGDVTCCYNDVNKEMDKLREGKRVYILCIAIIINGYVIYLIMIFVS